eukprot:TRINITY_DN6568_c0_g2_i2.p1 TRINITY_DN6568_c0_g2~~TRINITY_DN6568_c0_g2_i2.p1  ORF type:complete len:372 (-),score=56.23 TRINITY_DN6568_c0_g2_i2:188-1303(-)
MFGRLGAISMVTRFPRMLENRHYSLVVNRLKTQKLVISPSHRFLVTKSLRSSTTIEVEPLPLTSIKETISPKDKPGFIDAYFPPSIQPYLRLARVDKPVGTLLLLWPCWWGVALATPQGRLPDPFLLGAFGVGCFFWRGAGCVVDDMWDQDIDRKVKRTAKRPMAAGEVGNVEALLLAGAQLAIPIYMMSKLDRFSFMLGMMNLPIGVIYPYMKRITHWPQLVLGINFNWGILLGWSAIHRSLNLPVVLPMYLAAVAWTMHYDTIYALQDREDDQKIGVKSTAVLFGDQTKEYLTGFSATTVTGLVATGVAAGLSWPYFASVALTGGHLAWQLLTLDTNNNDDCSRKFIANGDIGALIFGGIVASRSGYFS